jgi:hypothetical protein
VGVVGVGGCRAGWVLSLVLSARATAVGEWLMAVAPGILIRVYGTSCVVVGLGCSYCV